MWYNIFGDTMCLLKKLRIKNNYSCKDMASMLNISSSYYSQIENRKKTLTYKLAFDIAKIFDLKPDDLFLDDFK